jgi:hypothetical protein
MQSTGTSSDIEEEIYPMDKYNYVKLVPDQDNISQCTKLQVLQETEYPESYYQKVRFLDNIEAVSKKVPRSIYHDRTKEIKHEFAEKEDKYPRTIYTSAIYPIVWFNINVPTVLGDFRIDRHVQEAPENLNTSNICRDINDPRYFPYNPSLDDWYKQQKQESDYVINTYTKVRQCELLTGVRRGSWQERITTIYRHQQNITETNCNGKIRSTEDQQVGRVHKILIDKAVKCRKQRKTAATWYIQESFNPVINPDLQTEILHFLSSYWVHRDSTNHFMNV